jgi:hypothetical protein
VVVVRAAVVVVPAVVVVVPAGVADIVAVADIAVVVTKDTNS